MFIALESIARRAELTAMRISHGKLLRQLKRRNQRSQPGLERDSMARIAPISRRTVNSALLCALTAARASDGLIAKDLPQSHGPLVADAAKSPASQAAVTPPTATPAPSAPPILSFDEAVTNTARAVLTAAPAPAAAPATVVIDPLVDEITGYQSSATQSIQARIVGLVKKDFPQYAAQPITSRSLEQQPRFLIGTFTPINAELKPVGQKESYWFCLVMGDLKTGKIVAKSVARARMEGVDATPAAAFADSPIWTQDPSIQAYVATCKASKVGDPIRPEYLDGLLAAALVSEAGDAYQEGRYAEALNLYKTARVSPAGEQLRVYNGIYLALTKLRRTGQAAAAFGDLVDYGLRRKRLAVKFLFRPGSIRFAKESSFSGDYDMWLRQIASRAVADRVCLHVTGHTSPSGPLALNDRLSLLRAEYIQSSLETDQPALAKRIRAAGMGSRENLIGTGRDDASDMLDRRVELNPIEPCTDASHA
jgi:outer membrane protein OmpA-like peptidoglycan-associated protein